MLPSSDLKTGENSNGETTKRRERRRRLQLSCGECRKKKLSCDRSLPCQRCVRSGRPEHCSFETENGTRQQPVTNDPSAQQQARRNNDEIRDLRAEVAQLKALLSKTAPQQESDCVAEAIPTTNGAERRQAVLLNETFEEDHSPTDAPDAGLSDPRERSPRGYYSQHTLLKFFGEIPQLFPFIKETSDEWLKPLGVNLKKPKPLRNGCKTNTPSQEENPLGGLLPPRDDTDALVSFYLNHLEPLHRVVHIPTFKREYANFWVPGRTRYPSMTALVLSMISISTCTSVSAGDPTSIPSTYRAMLEQWILACEEWLRQQSPKHRKLVHYQASCLVYLAKRMNMIGKKRWWMETGSLIQNAIMDGLNYEASPTDSSPYMREMKRRIWAVLRELDLHNAFEYGLPTFLHNINSNVAAPANLDDEDFDEASKVLPIPKPPSQYTYTSYQSHSSHSWTLRLEMSRRLSNPGISEALSYEDVLRYTHEITQAIHSLPPWNMEQAKGESSAKLPLLTYAYLYFQLAECILAIHRPYIQRDSSKFWISENTCYQISRDILLLNSKLAGFGLQGLTLLREDLLLASLNLTCIIMLQPKHSTSMIMTSSESAIDLLEQCLPFMDDRYLRSFYGEPWCSLTMCAAIMLLKIHLGKETLQTAKSSCARRFLDLHYKHVGLYPTSQNSVSQINTFAACQQVPTPNHTDFAASEWLDSSYPDIDVNPFDLDMELDSVWETWGSTWPTSPSQSMVE